jgi:hypothetical protein
VAPRDVTVHIVADRLAPRELSAVDSGGGGGQVLLLLAAKGRTQTTSDLFNIDSALASESDIGAIGWALTAIVQDPTTGIVYGATSNNSGSDPHSLVSIDPVTGAGTFIAGWANSNPMTGFAISSVGVAYGTQAAGIGNLQRLNLSDGTQTDLGAGPGFGYALAFDDSDVLWCVYSGDVGTLDLSTGTETSLYTPTFDIAVQGVTFMGGLLWIVSKTSSSGAELYTMDPTDGTVTDIGTFATTYVDALGWAIV